MSTFVLSLFVILFELFVVFIVVIFRSCLVLVSVAAIVISVSSLSSLILFCRSCCCSRYIVDDHNDDDCAILLLLLLFLAIESWIFSLLRLRLLVCCVPSVVDCHRLQNIKYVLVCCNATKLKNFVKTICSGIWRLGRQDLQLQYYYYIPVLVALVLIALHNYSRVSYRYLVL
jgi:hypothetical protein